MIMLELIESIRQHYDELEDKLKSLELELKVKDKRIKEQIEKLEEIIKIKEGVES